MPDVLFSQQMMILMVMVLIMIMIIVQYNHDLQRMADVQMTAVEIEMVDEMMVEIEMVEMLTLRVVDEIDDVRMVIFVLFLHLEHDNDFVF